MCPLLGKYVANRHFNGLFQSSSLAFAIKGRVQGILKYNRDSSLAHDTRYSYKKKFTAITYQSVVEGKLRTIRSTKLNLAGEWLKKRVFDRKEVLKEMETRTFDDQGRVLTWELRNAAEEVRKRAIYAYNDSTGEATSMLEVVVFPTEPPKVYGPFLWRTFDAAGNVLAEYENGNQQQAWTYNGCNQVVTSTQWAGKEVERTQEAEYNAEGRLSTLTTYNAQGDVFFRSTYRYNAGGLLQGAETRYPTVGRVVKKRWVIFIRKDG